MQTVSRATNAVPKKTRAIRVTPSDECDWAGLYPEARPWLRGDMLGLVALQYRLRIYSSLTVVALLASVACNDDDENNGNPISYFRVVAFVDTTLLRNFACTQLPVDAFQRDFNVTIVDPSTPSFENLFQVGDIEAPDRLRGYCVLDFGTRSEPDRGLVSIFDPIVLDTFADMFMEGWTSSVGANSASDHGFTIARTIESLICDRSPAPNCLAEVLSAQALQATPPDSLGSPRFSEIGGAQSELARAIMRSLVNANGYDALRYAACEGATIVAAAGNNFGRRDDRFIISVGGVTDDGEPLQRSREVAVDVAALGTGSVHGANNGVSAPSTAYLNGTSVSTAVVSAAAAAARALGGGADVLTLLSGAQGSGTVNFGHGAAPIVTVCEIAQAACTGACVRPTCVGTSPTPAATPIPMVASRSFLDETLTVRANCNGVDVRTRAGAASCASMNPLDLNPQVNPQPVCDPCEACVGFLSGQGGPVMDLQLSIEPNSAAKTSRTLRWVTTTDTAPRRTKAFARSTFMEFALWTESAVSHAESITHLGPLGSDRTSEGSSRSVPLISRPGSSSWPPRMACPEK